MPYKDPEARKAYLRAYSKRPDVRVKERARSTTPEAREKARQRKADPVSRKIEKERSRLQRTGFTVELVNSLMALQNGKCAVCGADLNKLPAHHIHADHDHQRKKPRGLLCNRCNVAEGMIRKTGLSPAVFSAFLQRYLDNPPVDILELI